VYHNLVKMFCDIPRTSLLYFSTEYISLFIVIFTILVLNTISFYIYSWNTHWKAAPLVLWIYNVYT